MERSAVLDKGPRPDHSCSAARAVNRDVGMNGMSGRSIHQAATFGLSTVLNKDQCRPQALPDPMTGLKFYPITVRSIHSSDCHVDDPAKVLHSQHLLILQWSLHKAFENVSTRQSTNEQHEDLSAKRR